MKFSGRIQMFQRKNISAPKTPPLKDYDIIIDYCACMVSISLATPLVDAFNVSNEWSARQLSDHLNSRSHLSSCSNFFINSVALMHGFIVSGLSLFRKCGRGVGVRIIRILNSCLSSIVRCHLLMTLQTNIETFGGSRTVLILWETLKFARCVLLDFQASSQGERTLSPRWK